MTNEIELYSPPEPRRAWLELLEPVAQLANAIGTTDFVPNALRGKPGAITAAVLYGDELGLSPMQSLAKIHVIDGRPALAAETQRALVLAAGHEVWLEEANTTSVTWCGRRAGSDHVTKVTWTLDDARKAGLDGRQNWRKYPRAMLSARASAELCRALFPDVLGGMMATEELDDGDTVLDELPPDPGEDDTPTPAKRTAKRTRKAKAPKPAAERAPAPAPEALPALPTAPKAAKDAEPASGPPPAPTAAEEPSDDDGGPSMPWPNFYAMRTKELGLDDDGRHLLTMLITTGRTESSKAMTAEERDFARTTLDKLKERTRRIATVDGMVRLEGKAHGEVFVERELAIEAVSAAPAPDEPEDEPEPPHELDEEAPTAPPAEEDDLHSPDDDDVAEAELVDDEEDDPVVSNEADLARLARSKSVKVADVLRKAGEGLSAAGRPKSLADIAANPTALRRVTSWLLDL